jgi:coenzyme PQQ precursor peptide PqqA
MARRLAAPPRRPQHSVRGEKPPRAPQGARATPQEIQPMQWQTPTAIDFRFGFEITMYVANR